MAAPNGLSQDEALQYLLNIHRAMLAHQNASGKNRTQRPNLPQYIEARKGQRLPSLQFSSNKVGSGQKAEKYCHE